MSFRFNCLAFAISLALVTDLAQAACFADSPLTRPDERYQAVDGSNGAEVKDTQTGLVWQRCMLGQTWEGSACSGNVTPQDWPRPPRLWRAPNLGAYPPKPSWKA